MNAPPEIIKPEKQTDVAPQPVSDLPSSGNDVDHLRLTEQEVDMLYYNYLRQKAIKSVPAHPQTPVTPDVPPSTPTSGR